ncbi:MAG: hypothetical protein U0625_06765 [Phycisphaerales bacterium]
MSIAAFSARAAIAATAALGCAAFAQVDPGDCGACCAVPPQVSGFTAPALVSTMGGVVGSDFVVHAFGVGGCTTQPPGPWVNPPAFRHPDWTLAKLGSVFGVTVDSQGNVYVAHTSVYDIDALGTVGGGGAGAIYKLDSATGTPSLFCTLPNSAPCSTPGTFCAPGIGNLTYSCEHHCIYATDFEDGRIYRISMTGALLEAYSFGDQAIQSAAPMQNDPIGIAPWGKRTWAVAVAGDRLYFSVVRADMSYFPQMPGGPPGPPYPPPAADQEIWSIPLTPVTGAFASGNSTLEIRVPKCNVGIVNPFNTPLPPGILSNPVSDIAFDGDCCMYLAERTMNDATTTGAHCSRLLKYCRGTDGTPWSPSNDLFEVGQTTCSNISLAAPNSDAGGVGIDPSTCNLVWTTADYMEMPWCNGPGWYYGINGLPLTGGVNAAGLHIDMNGDVSYFDKTRIGSVEVACRVADPCTASAVATCHLGPDGLPDGTYDLSITVHNGLDGQAANFILLPDLGTYIPLVPPLNPGESRKLTTTVTGQGPGTLTLDIGLFNSFGADGQCCGILDVEVELPDCDCMLVEHLTVDCTDDRDPTTFWYDVQFTVRNTSAFVASHFFIIPVSAGVTTVPQYVALPALLPGQTAPISFTLKFPGPPPVGPDGLWHTSISFSMHSANLAICCKKVWEISGPRECAAPLLGDLDGDGDVDGADLGRMLAAWGAAAAPGAPGDLNVDGTVDGVDLGVLLGAWAPR